jgi:predicted DNA-binding protein (MmcQ/YjbR family)
MVSIANFKKLALSFEDTAEEPHFELTSFRYKKKIFATLDSKKNRACIMLTPVDQSTFCTYDKNTVYPVPNKWGSKGATYVELKKVSLGMLKDMLQQAYRKINKK